MINTPSRTLCVSRHLLVDTWVTSIILQLWRWRLTHSQGVCQHLFGSLILILSSIYPALGLRVQTAFLFKGLSGHFSQWLYHVTFPQLKHKPSLFLYLHCHLLFYVCYGVLLVFNLLFLKITILVGTKEHPLVALSYISLTIMDGAHLFPHLLTSCMFLEGCLARFSTSWVWDGHYTSQLPHFHSETLTF